jgi:hypothetical protein
LQLQPVAIIDGIAGSVKYENSAGLRSRHCGISLYFFNAKKPSQC